MSRYLFIIPTLFRGGAERQVSVLSNALIRQGQEVCILKYYSGDGEYPLDEKVKVISFVKDAAEYSRSSRFKKILFIRKAIKAEQPDFVLPFLFHTAFAAQIASFCMKVDIFQMIRNNPAVEPPKKLERFIRDKMVHKAVCCFSQNETQKQYFDETVQDRIHILFNSIDDSFFEIRHKPSGEDFVFCAAGRLTEQKNFELLICSFIKAFEKAQNVKLIIYGEGHLREKLQNLIDDKGYALRILLPGRTDNMEDAYAGADVFVLSSNYEGMPNALIEAMAAGVPCIATDCPTGPSDLIDHGLNGILIPVNDENAMAKAMKLLYQDRELRNKFAETGRNKIKRICSSDIIAKQLIEICESNNKFRKQ